MDSPSNQPQQSKSTLPAADPAASATPARPARRLPHRVIIEQPLGGLRKFLLIVLMLALGISIMFNVGLVGAYRSYVQSDPSMQEVLHSGAVSASDKVAIISVEGPIMESDGFIKKQIDRVMDDDRVKSVVVRVDSPGGTVTASHYLFHHLKKLKKEKNIPLVVSMGGLAASGGYYVSMAAGDAEDTIFAEETTWTGSIGVLIPSYDISQLLSEWNIRDRTYASGELKQMGSPTRLLDEESQQREAAKFQQLVDESFNRFKEVVAYGRPNMVKDQAAMNEVVTGQIFTAAQAYQLGLVDKIGYLEDAVKRAAELAGLDEEKYRVIQFKQPLGLLDIALSQQAASRPFDLTALLDLTAPRAYYLCTWLPSIAVNQRGVSMMAN